MDYQKEFTSLIASLSQTRDFATAFSDFLFITAATLNNFDPMTAARRNKYSSDLMKKYSEQEVNTMGKMFDVLVSAYDENPEQDFLGKFYSENNLANNRIGQNFSPYSIGYLTAALTSEDVIEEAKKKSYITVNDCACGSGVLLIAHSQFLKSKGINYQQKVLYYGEDISLNAVLMSYIQLSLLGCAAHITVHNTLSAELPDSYNTWLTPMCFQDGWVIKDVEAARRILAKKDNIIMFSDAI